MIDRQLTNDNHVTVIGYCLEWWSFSRYLTAVSSRRRQINTVEYDLCVRRVEKLNQNDIRFPLSSIKKFKWDLCAALLGTHVDIDSILVKDLSWRMISVDDNMKIHI